MDRKYPKFFFHYYDGYIHTAACFRDKFEYLSNTRERVPFVKLDQKYLKSFDENGACFEFPKEKFLPLDYLSKIATGFLCPYTLRQEYLNPVYFKRQRISLEKFKSYLNRMKRSLKKDLSILEANAFKKNRILYVESIRGSFPSSFRKLN